MKIEFTVAIKPFGKQRPSMTRTGHAFTPQKTKIYESCIKNSFTKQFPDFNPFDSAIMVDISFYFIKAKTNKHQYHTIKPDVDNLIKAICDALNGIAYLDDRQIISIVARKEYAALDGVKIIIESLGE